VKKLQLKSDGRVLYQGDGDLFGQLPLKITILPSALEIAGAGGKKTFKMRLKLIEKIKEKVNQ
jgi:diacylglycerol kinase family enzyme